MQPNDEAAVEIARLKRRLERERATRFQAEAISEKGLRDLYERQRELQLLAKITAAANQTASVAEALQFALMHICEYTNWEVGHAYFTAGTGDALRLQSTRMWHASDTGRFADFQRATEHMEFPSGIGLPGRALATGKPLIVIDVTKDANFPRQPLALACGLRGASTFPVLSGSEVVAVLEFFHTMPREPSDAFLALMSQIGMQLGRVIERQRAEDDLRARALELTRARDEAKAADKAKSSFLATMSHELRTPLNAIIGFSEMIMGQILGPLNNERYRLYAGNIHSSGRHLLSVINDILDISKLDSEYAELRDDMIDLEKIISDCARMMEPLAAHGKIRLAWAVTAGIPYLRADDKRLRQILFNLLSNPIKFTPENGQVSIFANLLQDHVTIIVSDTGIGMADEHIPKALERFGQIDSTLARKYEGTGLGLPLTKRLIELHGGTLAIESKVGVGTTITVSFPSDRVVSKSAAA